LFPARLVTAASQPPVSASTFHVSGFESQVSSSAPPLPPPAMNPSKTKPSRKKESSVQRPASRAAEQPDLAAHVAALQEQIATLKALVEQQKGNENRESGLPPSPPLMSPFGLPTAGYPASPVGTCSGFQPPVSSSPATSYPPPATNSPVSSLRSPVSSSPATSYQLPATNSPVSSLKSQVSSSIPIYELKETQPVGYQTQDILDSATEESQDGFYTGLLDRARIQWLMGDWEGLAKIDLEQIEHHPESAKLAALSAVGHSQIGQFSKANSYILIAYEWGGSKEIISKLMLSGAFISLGRAAEIGKQRHRAWHNFKNAVSIVSKTANAKLLIQKYMPDLLVQMDKEQAHDYWRTSMGIAKRFCSKSIPE
jgi:hypothetical protein